MTYNKLQAHGVILHRLTDEYIELIRIWRNSTVVNRWMEFRQEISPEAQKRWFESLDYSLQYYYLIEHNGKFIGLVNLKNVDNATNSAEGGIFIADEEYQNGTIAFQAILTMYDFGFNTLALSEITAHILVDNPRAIRFNQALGFQKASFQDGVTNQLWRLLPDEYHKCTKNLRAYLGG